MVLTFLLTFTLAVQAQRAQHGAGSVTMAPADQTALRTALDAYDQGKLELAEPVLVRLTHQYPGSYEANEALGSLYAEGNQAERALPFLRAAILAGPRQALAHANLGAVYLKLSKPAEAVAELESAAKLDPGNASTQANLGQALMLARQPAAAAKAFAVAASASPGDLDLRYNRAVALYESGSSKEAGALIDSLPPASLTPEMHSLAGDADEHAGEFGKALAHYEAAARANPTSVTLYTVVAELMRHWNWDEAIQVADYGVGKYPADTHFRMASGIARYARGDYAAAVGIFSTLLKEQPENAVAADLLGRSCGALADGENAGCGVVAEFAQRHPGNAVMSTYAAIAILHAPSREQNLDRAATLLQSAIASDPKYAEAYLRMGVLEQMRLHWAESATYLERAVALSPTAPEAHYRLSRAYAHLGRGDEAQAQIALQRTYAQKAKDSLDSRLQDVMRFVLNPG